MGCVNIQLADMDGDEHWYPLEPMPGCEEPQGELQLRCAIEEPAGVQKQLAVEPEPEPQIQLQAEGSQAEPSSRSPVRELEQMQEQLERSKLELQRDHLSLAGISVDPQLRSWLVQHQFDGILPGLVELGVRTMQDLCYIRDDEMCVSSLLPGQIPAFSKPDVRAQRLSDRPDGNSATCAAPTQGRGGEAIQGPDRRRKAGEKNGG